MKLDTLAEVRRQCYFVASEEDDKRDYREKEQKAQEEDGLINILERDAGDFKVYSNEKRTYVIINDCGVCTLYQVRK